MGNRPNIRYIGAIVAMLIMALLSPCPASAAELIVGERPGEYPTIQSAIDDARDGDEILIAAGTWQETIDLRGKAIVLGPLDGEVILDAAGAGSVIRCTSGEGTDTIIEGLVIRGGLAERGAGLLTRNSTPTIRDCIFEANESLADGAAWAGDRGGPTFVGCLFLGNTAGEGETFSCGIDCTPLVLDCRFTGNCPQPKVDDWPAANASNLVEELPDTCTQALELIDGSTPFATVCAANERPGHAECELEGDAGTIAGDIWYRYTPATTGLLRLSTCEYSDFDTDLAVYRGDCEQLELLGCNDDAPGCPGGPSELLLPVRMGDALLIRLGGGVEGAAGTGRLQVDIQPNADLSISHPQSEPEAQRGDQWYNVCPTCEFTTIQSAINATGGTYLYIAIAPGTYYENLDVRGKAITLFGQSGSVPVTIDGGGVGPVITAGGQDGMLHLQNLVIQNGSHHNGSSTAAGGGLAIALPIPENGPYAYYWIENCTFQNNQADLGGAIGQTLPYGSPAPYMQIDESSLISNSADVGGGLYGNLNLYMNDSIVEQNEGGGLRLYFNSSEGTWNHLVRTTISYNDGVGLWMGDFVNSETTLSQCVLNNCLIAGNAGTGIYCTNGYFYVLQCTIAHNSSSTSTAGIYHNACGGLGHYIGNSIIWGNRTPDGRTFQAQYDTPECVPFEQIVNCIFEENELVDDNVQYVNNTGIDPVFEDPLGPDQIPGTNDGEVYALRAGSGAIDAAYSQATATESWWWFDMATLSWDQISPMTDITGAQHDVDDPAFESDVGLPYNGIKADLGCYELLDGSAGNPRLFVWSNMASGNNTWTSTGNWYSYDPPAAPSGFSSALFSADLVQNPNPGSVPDYPTGPIPLLMDEFQFGPGEWIFDENSPFVFLGSMNIGMYGGDEPSLVRCQGGAQFTCDTILIDGDGEGILDLSEAGTEIALDGDGGFGDGEILMLRGGRLIMSDGTMVLGRINNLDGVFERIGDMTLGGTANYIQAGTLNGNPAAGTMALQAGEEMTIDGGIKLGGTMVIDFDGTNPKAGDIIEILKYSSSEGETKNVVIQPLGLPPGSFLKISLEEVEERDRSFYALMGEITTVGQVFGLNQAAESPITAVPTDAKLADVDADGFLDLAFTLPSSSGSGNLVVMLNQGDDLDGDGFWDGFEPVASITVLVGVDPSGVDVGDVDGTGTLDAVVSNEGSGNVTVIRDLGGSPSASTIELDDSLDEPEPTDLCLFDVEDDGTNEILVACENDGTLRILAHGLRSGSAEEEVINFAEAPPFEIDPSEEEDTKNAGVLIVSRASNKATSMRRGIGSRIGALEVASVLTTDATPVDIAIADFDGNEVEDYVVINEDGNSFDIFLREDDDGDGYPEVLGGATVGLLATGNPRSVATGDFDTDGDMDIAIVLDNEAGARVTRIWRNDRIVEIDGVLVDLEYLTFTDTGTELPSDGEPIIVVAGDVDDVGAGGDPSQVGDDAVILSSGSALRSDGGGTVTPNVGGPAKVDTVDGFVTAFKNAQDGDSILLAGGDYYLPNTLAFDGRDLRLIGRVDAFGNPLTVIHAPSAGSRTFTMTGGLTSSSLLQNIIIDGDGVAGGIYMQNTTDPGPQLVNCIFRDCFWPGSGAGLRADNAHPDLQDCQFDGCISEDDGGGVFLFSAASMDATNTIFEDCRSTYGGALYIYTGCRGDLSSCDFELNEATTYHGGAIAAYSAELTIEFTGFELNSTTSTDGYGNGGAIMSYACTTNIDNCNFIWNASTGSGGGIAAWGDGSLDMNNCLLYGNTTSGGATAGGGLQAYDISLSGSNNEFDSNASRVGGGASLSSGLTLASGTLANWTFTDNEANVPPADGYINVGGGLFLNAPSTSAAPLVLIGFDFNGNSSGYGGGMHINDDIHVELQDCDFNANRADLLASSDGGGIYMDPNSSVLLDSGCEFITNTASDAGGAICSQAHLEANGALFSSNTASGSGGALYLSGNSTTDLNGCIISGNSSVGSGGAIRSWDGASGQIIGCQFNSNTTDYYGGAAYLREGRFDFTSCTFYNCIAVLDGGAIFYGPSGDGTDDYGDMSFTNCDFDQNSAAHGSAICQYQNDPNIDMSITSCSFTDNTSSSGTVRFDGGALTVLQCDQITGNTSGGYAAIFLFANEASATIMDCIATDNTSGNAGFAWVENDGITTLAIGSTVACDNGSYIISGPWTDLGDNCISVTCDADNDGVLDCNDSNPDGPNTEIPGSIQSAIDAASNGDTIILDAGTYTAAPGAAALIDTGGKSITIQGQTGRGGVPTTILDGEDMYKAFYIHNSETESTVFRNLLIQNCSGNNGGGGYITTASPRFESCWFIDNISTNYGGGVHLSYSNSTFIDCVFQRNWAQTAGGAVMTYNSVPSFTDCIFGSSTDELSGNSTDGFGGAVFIGYGSITEACVLTNCDFFSNHATQGGGAIHFYSGISAILNGCRFGLEGSPSTGNTTSTPSYAGGAVNVSTSLIEASNCEFHHNLSHYGGGMYTDDCHKNLGYGVSLQSCRFTNNESAGGGGFYGLDSTINIEDTTFDTNQSTASNGAGGAIYARSVPNDDKLVELEMTNCTLVRNTTVNWGGGLAVDVADVTLESCTFGDPADPTAGNTSVGAGGAVRLYNVASSSNPFSTVCTATIRGGGFYGNHSDTQGGGLEFLGMPVTIELADDDSPCIFSGNTTGAGTPGVQESDRGGAIYTSDMSFADYHDLGAGPILSVTGAIFENNSTEDEWGGACYLHDVNTEFTDCTFTGNSATMGGAIRCFRRTTTLTNCDFTDNIARFQFDGTTYGSGGAISSDNSGIVATECTFAGNESQALGGAIWNKNAVMTCTDCNFNTNSSDGYGGGIYAENVQAADGHSLSLTACLIDGNTALLGGGVFLEGASMTATNCDFTQNAANTAAGSDGGAINLSLWGSDPSEATLVGCTVTGNQATATHAIYNASGNLLAIESSTICDNTDTAGTPQDSIHGAWTDLGNNCISIVCDSDADGIPDCDDTYPDGPNPGVPGSLQAAVDAASNGDVITLAAGTYIAELGATSLLNTNGVTVQINGAVDGNGNPTSILDGQGSIRILEVISGEQTGTSFHNLVFANGVADVGGAVRVTSNSVPTFDTCWFVDNVATSHGGAVGIDGGFGMFENCRFAGNQAGGDGGAVWATNAPSLTILDCTFHQCTSTDDGGAIATQGGTTLWVIDSEFGDETDLSLSCTAGDSGGAIYIGDALDVMNLENSYLYNAQALFGGGIYCYGTIDAQAMLLDGCQADAATGSGGGLLLTDGSTCTMTQSTFKRNSAWIAGAIYGFTNTTLTATNCLFGSISMDLLDIGNGNTAYYDGGVIKSYGTVTLDTCDIRDNHAARRGGGVLLRDGAIMDIHNCNFEGNSTTGYLSEWIGGGGLYLWDVSGSCTGTNFVGNASQEGGGIRIGSSGTAKTPILFSGCMFMENEATAEGDGTGGQGAGLMAFSGTYNIELSSIIDNTSSFSGGGIWTSSTGDITLNDTQVCENSPDQVLGLIDDANGCVSDYCGDSDNDGTPDCDDGCPYDSAKIDPGSCGCGVEDDADGNGFPDCLEGACLADIDDSGTVDVTDLLAVIAAWGVCSGDCPADIDGSGSVDVTDLLSVIGGWGVCPGAWLGCSGDEEIDESDYGCVCFVDGDDSTTDCNGGPNNDGAMTPYVFGQMVCGTASVYEEISGSLYRDTDYWDDNGVLDAGGTFTMQVASGAAQRLAILDLDSNSFVHSAINLEGRWSPIHVVTIPPGNYCIWIAPLTWNADWTCSSGLAEYSFRVTSD